MSRLGVAALQLSAARSGNIDLVEAEIRAVVKRFAWVELVVLGELVIHGTSLDAAEPAGGETEARLAGLARELGIWLIPGSVYEERDGQIYNAAPVFDPLGQEVARHHKLYPFLPYERNVASGTSHTVFDIPGIGRIGIAICYDMWFPEAMRTLAAMGAEAIIVPGMTNTVDRDVEVAIARANSATCQAYFIDVNVAGDLGNGRTVAFGPGGESLYECGTGRDIAAFELDFGYVRGVRERGWHGLGQVLKSFRDGSVAYPLHASASARHEAMRDLGPLAVPRGLLRRETEADGGLS
ncbi:MAG TPA: carbon-nitrogen hydrolase family protein [Sphingomonadaceae bacterium]|nr:carbon-nitrogen hydrolase family protein [Sphingomonadaceae bacterium]